MNIPLPENVLQSDGGMVSCWIKLYTENPSRIYYYEIGILSVLAPSAEYQLQVNCQLYRAKNACDEAAIDMQL